MSDRIDITPATKVGALLKSRPELFEPLVGMAPAFRKLRNPILRKTVGRVATLARAAKMVEMHPVTLVNRLRAEAGLELIPGEGEGEAGHEAEAPPAWIDEVEVRRTLDADALLEAGESPLARIRKELKALEAGEALLVTSTFRPAPLVDALRKGGRFRIATRDESDGYETHIASLEES